MIEKMRILWALLWIGLISSFFFLTLEQWLICLILGHFLGCIGQVIALHRYFVHRAFKTNKFWHYFLMYIAVIVGSGSTILYKSAHIKHHRYVDKEGDPHSPKYIGYSLGSDRLPVYEFETGSSKVSIKIQPGPSTQTLRLDFSSENKEVLEFSSPSTQIEVKNKTAGKLSIVIRPNAGERFSSEEKKEPIKKPTTEIGEKLYTSLGCIACHSLDGGKNHGPTLKDSFGSKREFLKASSLVVDEAYIRESIENPMAKTVKGYLTGMMPPYKLQEAEYDSLILFIKSVR